MKLNGIEAEIEHEGELVVIKLKMKPEQFVNFVAGCNKKKSIPVNKPALTIDDKKNDLLLKVAKYKQTFPDKYPKELYNQFMRYWTEPSKAGKSIRYDGEQYFDIGKRLATFKANMKPEELSKMWEADKKTNQQATLL